MPEEQVGAPGVEPLNLDGILFPTTVAPAVAIETDKGSGEMSLNGGTAVPTLNTLIRNTDPAEL